MDNDIKEIKTEETPLPAEEKPPGRKRRKKNKKNKIKMNIWYKLAFALFCAAFCLMVAAMAVCIVEDNPDHNSLFAIWGARVSAGLAFIGIIFACVSKEKKPKAKKKKRRFKPEDEAIYEKAEIDE